MRSRELVFVGLLGVELWACGTSSALENAPSDAGKTGMTSDGGPRPSWSVFRTIDPTPGQQLRPGDDAGETSRGTMITAISADLSTLIGTSSLNQNGVLGIEAFQWTEKRGTLGIGFVPGLTGDPGSWISNPAFANRDGKEMIGWSYADSQHQHIFRWNEASGLVELEVPEAGAPMCSLSAASADLSSFAGDCNVGALSTAEPARWSAAGWQLLGMVPGYQRCSVKMMSDDGAAVVGLCGGITDEAEPFQWTAASGLTSLGKLSGTNACEVDQMTLDGKILVGSCINHVAPSAGGLFRWTEATGLVPLPGPPDASNCEVMHLGPNADWMIMTCNAQNQLVPFLWQDGKGFTPIGPMPGYPNTFVWPPSFSQQNTLPASRDGRVIIGHGANGNYWQGFRWTGSAGLVPLRPLPGHDFTFAQSVSNDGTIVSGYSAIANREVAYRAEPTAVLWNEDGEPRRVADDLRAAGLSVADFSLRNTAIAESNGKTMLYGVAATADGGRAWVAW